MLNAGQLEYACACLRQLFDTCQWRKMDMFLIPAIRSATLQAEPVVDQLEQLNDAAARALECCAQAPSIDCEAKVHSFCDALEEFCDALLTRLEIEERLLFPMAHAALPGEAWFSMANQILVHEEHKRENRGLRAPH